jgi:hypothetical protein
MYRLYVDEVGSDDLLHLDDDNHRYLSLTGVAMRVDHEESALRTAFDRIKNEIFCHYEEKPLVFHRTDIVNGRGVFRVIKEDEGVRRTFDRRLLDTMASTEYTVFTVLIDKKWMLGQKHWRLSHPYHFLMHLLVERYIKFLKERNAIGDIMPEARKGKKDKLLQEAFTEVKTTGTDYLSPTEINSFIRSNELKFRNKPANIAGLQLCDLIAHPSHIYIREQAGHPVTLGAFAREVLSILNSSKYYRSPSGKVKGYGIKCLP